MHQVSQLCGALTDTDKVLEETMFGSFVALQQTTTKNSDTIYNEESQQAPLDF